MARLVLAAIAGVVVGCTAGAALDISAREPTEEVVALALEASVDPYELEAAAATVGVSPRQYAYGTGLLAPPVPQRDGIDRLIDCLEWHESRGYAGAVNPRSGASGPLQYLPSTWRTTPQGKAGLSVFDPAAARAATRWMIAQGRLREWSTWRLCA
jgi:hypothetical protein